MLQNLIPGVDTATSIHLYFEPSIIGIHLDFSPYSAALLVYKGIVTTG